MIISKKLSNQKKISHGFFNKNGGRSIGIYKRTNIIGIENKKINLILNKKTKKNFKTDEIIQFKYLK